MLKFVKFGELELWESLLEINSVIREGLEPWGLAPCKKRLDHTMLILLNALGTLHFVKRGLI